MEFDLEFIVLTIAKRDNVKIKDNIMVKFVIRFEK